MQNNALNDDISRSESQQTEAAITFRQVIGCLLSNQIYVLVVLALSGLYFTVTGLQFWISDYLQVVL